jgi:hypothetical protein
MRQTSEKPLNLGMGSNTSFLRLALVGCLFSDTKKRGPEWSRVEQRSSIGSTALVTRARRDRVGQ